jgi:N-acetylated-alpha-linked acidic dipeptidase
MNALRAGAIIAAASLLFPLSAAAASPSLIGWANGSAAARELQYEHLMMSVPSAQRAMEIEHHISMVPHRAGTPADYATAQFVQQRLKADGFQTRVVKYQVWFTGPTQQSLDLVSPKRETFDLVEGTAPHTKWERMAGPAFLENSGDGDVTGPVYYVDTASKDDIATLDRMHVNLRGAVAIIRLSPPGGGGAFRSFDPSYNSYNELRKRGVAAILEFMDPATTGYGGGAMWPEGNYKNTHMAERMSGPSPAKSTFQGAPPGDPTYPGKAPVPGAKHLTYSQLPHATIPEMSITQSTARTLLAGLSGKAVPQNWHPMFEFVQRVGGNERVHVHVKMTRHLTTIWNVFGDLKGSEQPNSIVMIGSHRDAMTFGAIDPGSGTTVMMQDADALHKLVQNGYRPKRTIEIASWDGHELGLWGSASYIYQYGPQLRKSVFQYINTDQLTTGNPFVISATTGLWAFIRQSAHAVIGPDGLPLDAHDTKDEPLFHAMTGGSDHQNFGYMLGIPSSSNGFYGAFGAHHTAEDNIDGLRTYDPGMKEAVATAQQTLIQAMRAAGATVEPLRMAEMSAQFTKDLPMLSAVAMDGKVDRMALMSLMLALKDFDAKAKAIDKAMAAAESAGDAATMQKLAAKEQAARDAFYAPNGLAFNAYYHTVDRVFVSFPEIVFAGDNAKAQQAAVERFTSALQTASTALGQ